MIIIKLRGGLGNQMFQYATGKSLARKNNTDLKFDLSDYIDNNERSYRLNFFNIEESIATEKEINSYKNIWNRLTNKTKPWHKRSVINYNSYGFEPDLLKVGGNAYLDGYWKNKKYFSEFNDLVKKEFTLKKNLSENAKNILNKINETNSISLHVRRGDYLTNKKFNQIYKSLDLHYYLSAIKKINKSVSGPVFFIFTDDRDWVKNLSLPCTPILVSDYKIEDYEELYLMSQCKHNIIANSTFSWWSAWLNSNRNKIIIGPKVWFNFSDNDLDIMPKEWIKI
jgi:hypothetical protein